MVYHRFIRHIHCQSSCSWAIPRFSDISMLTHVDGDLFYQPRIWCHEVSSITGMGPFYGPCLLWDGMSCWSCGFDPFWQVLCEKILQFFQKVEKINPSRLVFWLAWSNMWQKSDISVLMLDRQKQAWRLIANFVRSMDRVAHRGWWKIDRVLFINGFG